MEKHYSRWIVVIRRLSLTRPLLPPSWRSYVRLVGHFSSPLPYICSRWRRSPTSITRFFQYRAYLLSSLYQGDYKVSSLLFFFFAKKRKSFASRIRNLASSSSLEFNRMRWGSRNRNPAMSLRCPAGCLVKRTPINLHFNSPVRFRRAVITRPIRCQDRSLSTWLCFHSFARITRFLDWEIRLTKREKERGRLFEKSS